jgi:hypothetical protein
MAWAVLLFALIVVFAYVAFDFVLPRAPSKRRWHPDVDITRENEDDRSHNSRRLSSHSTVRRH